MTYSIVARCPDTGQLGVAVQSHFFSVGSVVPWLEGGVGAVATQATAEVAHGPDGLARLRAGRSPAEALEDVLGPDEHAETRQVAIVDVTGRAAAHTGRSCIVHAGDIVGDGFTVQANMMDGPGVPEAMAAAFTDTRGSLAVRLLGALDAAQAAGDLDVALAIYADSIARQPDQPEFPFWHAVLLAGLGRFDEARAVAAPLFARPNGDRWQELVRRLPAADLLPAEAVVELLAPQM